MGRSANRKYKGGAASAWRQSAPAVPWIPSKVSFGVIVVRINPSSHRPEAVIVRARYTYAYAEFVHGKYSKNDHRKVAALIDEMSVDERLDLYSLNFAQMWYRIWLTADKKEHYNRNFAKFQTAWMREDSGKTLRHLIQTSRVAPRGTHYEFPKGKRLTPREADVNCAIRETEEEARVTKRD